MTDCPNLANCGFIKKYCNAKSLACQGFITLYCKGEKQNICERKAYKAAHNAPPPDDMMPNGHMMVSAA
jgi:hypothetical protein